MGVSANRPAPGAAVARLGVDTGGTFTDFVALDKQGRVHVHKQLSTPDDPSRAVLDGVTRLSTPATSPVVHGSTVATNALLERRGARAALITTRGFADVLAIGRQNRPELYALVASKPPPLVPRDWRFEVRERVGADGTVLTPLDPAELGPILARLQRDDIESVAVCLLFSFLHPAHERAIATAVAALPPRPGGAPIDVSLSVDILPEYREYERTAATVVNAYVAPRMAGYLGRLATGLAPRPLTIMQSNGGRISAATAARQAVHTVLSGPAGGVVGARYVAELAGYDHLITFDMGGTSTDVALCPGRLPTTSEGSIADLPLRLPIIDIHTVGAGGGSLARVDPGGALQVGPASAGADPGPACYGRGGDGPLRTTTTDANVVLGRLVPDHFLGGEMWLDDAAADDALAALAREMGVDGGAHPAAAAAWGVLAVANATMERAIRRISVERGYDPRDFTLVAFGGAGPLHACDLATRLRIPRVLVPTAPGVLSALGMLAAAPTKSLSRTVMLLAGDADDDARLLAALVALAEQARAGLVADGYAADRVRADRQVDCRYQGQSHELSVLVGDGETAEDVVARFHERHERRYGYRQPTAPVEFVTARVTALVPEQPPALERPAPASETVDEAIVDVRAVWFDSGEATVTAIYDRTLLAPGHVIAGPAIVVQYDTTTVVPPLWTATIDAFANMVLTPTG